MRAHPTERVASVGGCNCPADGKGGAQRRIIDLLRSHMDSIRQVEADWEAEQELAARAPRLA